MKIAVVSEVVYPYHKGGKEKRVFDITTRLVRAGHEVDIYTMKWWEGDTVREENGVKLHGVVPFKKLYNMEKGRRSIWQAIFFACRIFFPLLRAKFDVLDVDHQPFFPLFPTKLVALLKRKKLVATWLEVWGRKYWSEYLPKWGFFGFLLERLSVYLPDVFISISRLTTKRLHEILNVPREKIVTVPIGIDVLEIQKFPDAPKEYDCIFMGRLLSHKHVDSLIGAIKNVSREHSNVRCLIIGNGPERPKLLQLVESLGLEQHIVMKEFVQENELYSFLRKSRMFVLPSTREGFGIVVVEANAAGLPAIVIDHPENASKDLIEDGVEGFVCNLDEATIADKIGLLLSNESLRLRMGKAAVENARKYDMNTIVHTVESVYQSVM